MDKLKDYAATFGIELTDHQLEQFNTYFEMLIEKNKVMNLTTITDKDEVILKHFVDSLYLSKYFDFKKPGLKVIDVGTGAGFPGIPLKIVFPDIEMTLFDSLNKRVVFLNEVIEELGLKGIVAIHGRAEEGGRKKELRERFDLVLSRAVANMSVLCEYSLPFVNVGGYCIPYKSSNIEDEVQESKKAIHLLGGKYEKTEIVTLPDSEIGRSFVFIKKVRRTSKTYPRKPGTASREPL